MLRQHSEPEAPGIGQAMLDLSARLPEGYHDLGDPHDRQAQAGLCVSFDAGDEVWEVEFCALDPNRNLCFQDASLEVVLKRVLDHDREKAPDV